MGRKIPMIGKKFGSLLVLRKTPGPTPHAYFTCQCLLCGKEYTARGALLRDGSTTRCQKCAVIDGAKNRGKIKPADFAVTLYGKVAAGATQLELLDLVHDHIKHR